MSDTPTPEFDALAEFQALLDQFPHMSEDTRARLYVATIGAENENERLTYWVRIWSREAVPGLTLRALVLREHRLMPVRQFPTADQIIFALKAHADKKENAS